MFQKKFVLGSEISEKFYPRTKFFRNFPRNFCPMWGRTNFIWVRQNFSKNIYPREKIFCYPRTIISRRKIL